MSRIDWLLPVARGLKLKTNIPISCIVIMMLVSQLIAMEPTLGPYDESLILVGSTRVLAGDVPYKDFWTMYGPGQFYLTAWLFTLFGVQAVVLRLFDALVRTVIACLS
jgi:hypothetical protein